MRISTGLRRLLAALALIAIVVSGIGIAAVMVFGDVQVPSAQHTEAPRPPALPQARVPTADEFVIKVVVTDQACEPGGGCRYTYNIEPRYLGLHPLPETPFTVFYEVVGGNEPQPGEFTVHNEQAQILSNVVVEGPPDATLSANVVRVAG